MAGNMDIPVLAGLQLNKLTGEVSDSQKPSRYGDVLIYWKEKTAEQLRTDTLECGNFCIGYFIRKIQKRNVSRRGTIRKGSRCETQLFRYDDTFG